MANTVTLRGLGVKSPYPARTLIHKDGHRAYIGETITSFRGEKYVLTGWPNNGHNRVWVSEPGSKGLSGQHEFFPSVFNLKWED